jgi:anti-sigma B factor antagonist
MQVTLNKIGVVLCLQLAGRLDTNVPKGFEDALLRLIEQGETHLIFDFGRVEYISSSGLRVLVRAFKQVTYANGRMAFHSLNERVRRIFEVAGLTLVFRIYATREEAFAGMIASLVVPETNAQPQARLVVPLSAVTRAPEQQDGYSVFVVATEQGKQLARRRAVKLDAAFGNLIEISAGLQAGERVVVNGATIVAEGEQVQIAQ